jgi:Activator of Hsp90 ATPase homolog 1-like protein
MSNKIKPTTQKKMKTMTAAKKQRSAKNQNYTTSFTVSQSPEEVFAAINNVRGWWSGEIEGHTDKPGAQFLYTVKGMHRSKQKITEFVPGKKVTWHVTDAHLNFVEDKTEWKGTDIIFEIGKTGGKTKLSFTHIGLAPACDCFDDCSNGWNMLVNGNLRKLIATGKPQPSPW